MKKRDTKRQEVIQALVKKLKSSESKQKDDAQISIELKKRHDVLQKKLDQVTKGRNDTGKQLKQLFILFTK